MDTIEKKLTDYKGFEVVKVTDNKGLRNETITYTAYTQNDDLFDTKTTLTELKKSIDNYIK